MADDSIHQAKTRAKAEYQREYQRQYLKDPDNRARRNELSRGYRKKDEYKQTRRETRRQKSLARAAKIRAECEERAKALGLVLRTKAEARAMGLTKYFTGKPCKKYGHVAERYVSAPNCIECVRIYNETNKEKRCEYMARHKQIVASNPERASAELEQRKEQRRRAEARLLVEREKIAGRPRPSRCEVCGKRGKKTIAFDHCHRTNTFRGWLCDNCNLILGLAHDNPTVLRKLIRYLERHNGPEVQSPHEGEHPPDSLFGSGSKSGP